MSMAKSKQFHQIHDNNPGLSESVLDAVGDTPLVRIRRLFQEFPEASVSGKLEYLNPGGSMKDRIALAMIERAEAEGRIRPGDTLVEPTSGNTGIALAMAAAVKGYKLIIVMPMKMSEEKRRLMTAYGADLILTPNEPFDHPDNYIEVAKRLAKRPRTHLLDQYKNPGNPGAHYDGTGPEIWEQTGGRIDWFVCGMGTGGTITGTSRYLKQKNPAVKVAGADPEGSLFSGGPVHPYQVEGIGYDFWPEVLDKSVIDVMYRISDRDSFLEARRMAREEGILTGGSTGSVVSAARRLMTDLRAKNELEGKNIVIMAHDSGRSYLSKIYNDDWMREHGFLTGEKP